MLTAYAVKILGYKKDNWWNCVFGTLGFYLIALAFPIFYFWLKLVPESMTPIYLILQKIVMSVAIIYNYLRDDIEERQLESKKHHNSFHSLTIDTQ